MTIEYYPDWAVIHQALVTWVKLATGLGDARVMWMDSTRKARPPKPYVGLNIITAKGSALGVDETRLEYDEENDVQIRTTIGPRQFTLSINAYTDSNKPPNDSDAIMRKISQSIYTDAAQALFIETGIAPIDQMDANALGDQLGNRWEDRSQMDVIFGYVAESVETTDYVDRAVIGGIIKVDSGDEIDVDLDVET